MLLLFFFQTIFRVVFCSPDSLQYKENHQTEGEREQQMWRTAEDDEEDRRFWEEPTPYTPESRLETHRYIEEKRKAKDNIRYVFCFNIFWELKMNTLFEDTERRLAPASH